MSPYLQVSRECTLQRILFLNLSSKVWELLIDVAPWKTAQIVKTFCISRWQYYKLDRFIFEFIANIQLTWDAVAVQTRLSLFVISSSSSFFLFMSVLQTPTSTSIFRMEFPRVIYGEKLFQAGITGDKHSKQGQSSAQVISLGRILQSIS